jgi:23S rRNA pseudouridine2457 synthase
MAELYLFNKPFNVLSQFTDTSGRSTLADFIQISKIYPAGRLDYDSEGLLILTPDGSLQARIAEPKYKLLKTYWVQVEGEIDDYALTRLEQGVLLKDGLTQPAKAKRIDKPELWPRNPPIRFRKDDITSWIELSISEGRNRQIRRMTAEVGFPTLRLVRYSIGPWNIKDIPQGKYIKQEVHLPQKNKAHSKSKTKSNINRSKNKPQKRPQKRNPN